MSGAIGEAGSSSVLDGMWGSVKQMRGREAMVQGGLDAIISGW
jgi:hypothetical protein